MPSSIAKTLDRDRQGTSKHQGEAEIISSDWGRSDGKIHVEQQIKICDLPDLHLLAALLRFGAGRPERVARRRTQAWQVSIGHPLVHQTAPGRSERRKGAKRPAASLSRDRPVRRGRNEREAISR